MTSRTLPLGIDIGTTRIRVAQAHVTPQGPRIHAVATRDVPDGASSSGAITDMQYVGALIEDAMIELRTRERRCVASVGEPDAFLRTVRLPRMSSIERNRAARFEAQRYCDSSANEIVVRLHPATPPKDLWALGIAKVSTVQSRLAALRAARLRVVSIDHEACALRRAVPGFDAILDIGYERAALHVVNTEVPLTFSTPSGGLQITRAIELDLTIDEQMAEKRKRILGTAGAGERGRSSLMEDIARLLETARQSARISRVAMVGNGARLPNIASDLETATGVFFELPVSDILRGDSYPQDVVRSSAPDWALAIGLVLWRRR